MKIFGIRHHGPGSAKRLKKALHLYQPDCILMEWPADAQKSLSNFVSKGLKPPISLLLYPPKRINQAVYYPMAEFSPEWQTLLFAEKNNLPVIAMDLPVGINIPTKEQEKKKKAIRQDPLGHMATLAGFKDSEQWWDITFEQEEDDLQVFELIGEMMHALREGLLFDGPPLNIAREAYMRKCVRKAVKDGYQNIAIVCGAWHVPAIQEWKKIKASSDNARLKGLKKEKVEASWIPWNYERLAFRSGYRAGVLSPAWYELLFKYKKTVAIRWLSQVGRLMRKEGQDASPAHSLEAIRLAHNLTALRGKPNIGLEDLKDSAVTIFCNGDPTLFSLIERRLIIGEKVGKIPQGLSNIPLQKDFEQKVRSARLKKELETSEPITKELDLRKDTQRLASQIIHQLGILEINWGRPMKGSRFKKGSFKEKWKLKWSPDFYIKMIEAAIYGNSLEEAAKNKLEESTERAETLEELSLLMDKAINGNLIDSIPVLAERMKDLAALTKDISSLMTAITSLVQVFKYGNQRKTDVRFLKPLIEEIFIRINLGLPELCIQLEEEAARNVFKQIIGTNNATQLYNKIEFFQRWIHTLSVISQQDDTQMLLRGLCFRLLFDKGELSIEVSRQGIIDMLNISNSPTDFASWLEGFLTGSGLLLIHNEIFWEVINDWIASLTTSDFEVLLPIFRRTFSNFTHAERNSMLKLAKYGVDIQEDTQRQKIDKQRASAVLAQINTLLE